jgi:hypothetical protein
MHYNCAVWCALQVGASTDSSSVAYLRPETAQGIFTNFKNVQQSARTKVPFGIAQVLLLYYCYSTAALMKHCSVTPVYCTLTCLAAVSLM